MHEEEVFAAGFFADAAKQAAVRLEAPGLGHDEDGAPFAFFGGLYIDVRHVVEVQRALGGAHLEPLRIVAVQGVDAAEHFHGEVVHQFKVRHAPGEGAAFEGGDEAFPWCHAAGAG